MSLRSSSTESEQNAGDVRALELSSAPNATSTTASSEKLKIVDSPNIIGGRPSESKEPTFRSEESNTFTGGEQEQRRFGSSGIGPGSRPDPDTKHSDHSTLTSIHGNGSVLEDKGGVVGAVNEHGTGAGVGAGAGGEGNGHTTKAPIPQFSTIMSQTEDTNGLPVRFRSIVDSNGYGEANSPGQREIYHNNGLQTVFLPFKTAGSQLQPIPGNNSFGTLLPPPVRQVAPGTPGVPGVQGIGGNNYTSSLNFITDQGQNQTQHQGQNQPQIQQTQHQQIHPQSQQLHPPNQHIQHPQHSQHIPHQIHQQIPIQSQIPHHQTHIQPSTRAQNTPDINTSTRQQSRDQEQVMTSKSLGQPVSDDQLEARDNFMVNFRLRPDTKKSPTPNKLKPYRCSFPNCDWSFARQSDLRRHSKSHEAPQYYCPYWRKDQTCHKNGGAFNRLDVLKRHLRLVHYIPDYQAGSIKSKNDSGWCKACQKMFPNSKMFVEHCALCASSIGPTKWSQMSPEDNGEERQQKNGQPEEFLRDSSDFYDPNSNLITLSTVINEFEGQK